MGPPWAAMSGIAAMPLPPLAGAVIAAAAPVHPVAWASPAERFCSAVGSAPRVAVGFFMSMPPMSPIPMSFMVVIGRGRSGGTGALMPARGASVARAKPERSIASPTSV